MIYTLSILSSLRLTLRPLRDTDRLWLSVVIFAPLHRLPSTSILTNPDQSYTAIVLDKTIHILPQRTVLRRLIIGKAHAGIDLIAFLTAYVRIYDTRKGGDGLRAVGRPVSTADKVVVFALGTVGGAAVGQRGGELLAVGVFDTGNRWCGGDADGGSRGWSRGRCGCRQRGRRCGSYWGASFAIAVVVCETRAWLGRDVRSSDG